MNLKNEELAAFMNVYYFFTAEDFKISALYKEVLLEQGHTRESVIKAAQEAKEAVEARREKGNARTREMLKERRKADKNFTH